MSSDTDTQTDRTAVDELPSSSSPLLEHITVENDDAPDECAIFPCEATENELLTTWVTAQEGSYVDLESIR